MKLETRHTIRAGGLQVALMGTAYLSRTKIGSIWEVVFILMIGLGVMLFIVFEEAKK